MKNKKPVSKIDPALLDKVLGGQGPSLPSLGAAAGGAIPQPAFASFFHS
jgi:hypothetical protein